MGPRRRARLRIVLGCAWLVSAHRSFAQDSQTEAGRRFEQGTAYYSAGRYEEALEEFRASIALFDSPNTGVVFARTLAQIGRLADAASAYEHAVESAGNNARYADALVVARRELTELEPRVARLRVQLQNAPAGAHVQIDDRPIAND